MLQFLDFPGHYLLKWLSLSIRSTYFWSGLPDFQGRLPAGLQAMFHEFSTLVRGLLFIIQEIIVISSSIKYV